MKCIKSVKTGEITRVDDQDARKKVLTGEYQYVSKSVWKSEVRDKK